MTTDGYLEHYGVKGMRWGQRRAENAARAALPRAEGYSKYNQQQDRNVYGKRGADRINESLLKGEKLSVARRAEEKRVRSRNTKIYGAAIAAKLIYTYGPYVATVAKVGAQLAAEKYVSKKTTAAGKKAAANLFSDTNGIGSHKIVDLGFDVDSNKWS